MSTVKEIINNGFSNHQYGNLIDAEKAYLELVELHDYKKIDCVDKKGKLRDILDIQEDIYKEVAKELGI